MNFNDIKTRNDFNKYLTECTDDELNGLAYECRIYLTQSAFPVKSKMTTLNIAGHTMLDLIVSVSLEYMCRNALPF